MAAKKPAKRVKSTYRVRKAAKAVPVTDGQVEQAFGEEPKADTISIKYEFNAPSEAKEWPFATQMNLAKWQPSEAATRPGLYALLGHEGNFVPARLVLTDNGMEKNLTFYALSDGSEAKSHCIKSVYGPIEEPT